MRIARGMRVPALAVGAAVLLLCLSLPASAAGPKRIFIVKSDEKGNGQGGVTFELYGDTNGNGVRDANEPKLQTKVTDATGHATFDPVQPGKYIVHEVTPAGYADNPDKDVTIPNAKGPGPTIIFQNTPLPNNNRVNDPTGEKSIDDGTHVSDFGPAIAATPDGKRILIAWNDSAGLYTAGGPSAVSAAFSTDTGRTWGPQLKMRPASIADILLGDPAVAADPIQNSFFVASLGFKVAGAIEQRPIFVSRVDPNGFQDPVSTWPDIPNGYIEHGPSIAARAGQVFLANTISLGMGNSEIAFKRSTDGGQTWSSPVSISGLGTFDHVDMEVPSTNPYVAWTDYQGSAQPTYDILFSRSINGGEDFREPTFVRQATLKPGTPGQCANPSVRTVLGQVAVTSAADLAVGEDVTDLFVVYGAHGQGSDEGDVLYNTSHNGGLTWEEEAEVVGSAEGTQWGADIDVTPDGRVALTFWDSQDGVSVDPKVAYYDPRNDEFIGEPRSLTNGNPFPLWRLNPSFDTTVARCFGLGDPALFAPGSGFFFAWADGRDPGPAGNAGIDPNIYFAHDIGPFLDTSTSLSVSRTASEIEARGTVTPPLLAGARVTVTLFRQEGGAFERIGRKRARTAVDGSYSASFDRPDRGRCMITVVFEGSEGRSPSPPTSKTFSC